MTSVDGAQRRPATVLPGVAVVYFAGFVQGLTLVSFPALSAVLRQVHGIEDAAYGAIFLPQVTMAIVGAVVGGALARSLGLRALLVAAMLINGLSQALLAGSALLAPDAAYVAILLGTAALGLGFGVFGAPLNSYPPLFFPGQANAAVVAVHTVFGVGLAVGPLLAHALMGGGGGDWASYPLIALAAAVVCAIAATIVALPRPDDGGARAAGGGTRPLGSLTFWTFVAIAVLYAFAEGTFSNWAVVYLREGKELPQAVAGLALSTFWGALVAGRLLVTVLVLRLPAQAIWLVLPGLMIAAFLLLPYAGTPATGIGLFALAGLACSAFFPLSISLVSRCFPDHVAWVSSMMIAALMVGVGMGSFLIGALREMLAFEDLYRVSALYPLAALLLGLALLRRVGRTRRAAAED